MFKQLRHKSRRICIFYSVVECSGTFRGNFPPSRRYLLGGIWTLATNSLCKAILPETWSPPTEWRGASLALLKIQFLCRLHLVYSYFLPLFFPSLVKISFSKNPTSTPSCTYCRREKYIKKWKGERKFYLKDNIEMKTRAFSTNNNSFARDQTLITRSDCNFYFFERFWNSSKAHQSSESELTYLHCALM